MNATVETQCQDCETGTMKPVRILDQQLGQHHPMYYAVPEAKRSFWNSKYPIEGEVQAKMCNACGLIKLYGSPSES